LDDLPESTSRLALVFIPPSSVVFPLPFAAVFPPPFASDPPPPFASVFPPPFADEKPLALACIMSKNEIMNEISASDTPG